MTVGQPLGIMLAIALATLGIYNFLSGRRFVRDLLGKMWLSRRTLFEWDEYATRNPNVSDIIVCLTTTPSRVEHLDGALKSLLSQTVRPALIRLHMPDYSVREECGYELPVDLKSLRSIEIVHCQDDGPATKLIPALRDLPPDQPVLVVDDDMLYPSGMIAAYEKQLRERPDAAFTLSGWIVPDDLIDRPTTLVGNILQRPPVPLKSTRVRKLRQVDVFQGYASYLVQPRFFDLEAVTDYSDAPGQATYVDDVWLSGHCSAPKYVFPHGRYPFMYYRNARFFSLNSLGRLNRGEGAPEQRANTIVVRYLADRWMTSQKKPAPSLATEAGEPSAAGRSS